jgi:hypothetical protein
VQAEENEYIKKHEGSAINRGLNFVSGAVAGIVKLPGNVSYGANDSVSGPPLRASFYAEDSAAGAPMRSSSLFEDSANSLTNIIRNVSDKFSRGEVQIHDVSPPKAGVDEHRESPYIVLDTTPKRDHQNVRPSQLNTNNYLQTNGPASPFVKNSNSLDANEQTPILFFNDNTKQDSDGLGRPMTMEEFDEQERQLAATRRKKKYHVINVPTVGNKRVKIMAI